MRKILFLLLLIPAIAFAQGTTTQIRRGSTLPTSCVGGDIFIKSGSSAGFYFNVASGTCSWVGPTTINTASDVVAKFSGCSGTQYLGADGNCHTAIGSPAGSDTQVQFNDGGSFGGESNFVWDKTNHKLSLGNGTTQATLDFRGGTSAPSNPSANFCRQYFNTTSGVMEWINSSGTTCGPSSGTGTVTHTGGALTSGSLMVGAGSADSAVLASDPTNCSAGNAPTGIDKTGAAKGCASISGGSSGALVLLESHTASSSAELDFTTGITSTYDEYQIEILGIIPATNGALPKIQFSTNGGSTYDTGNNYDWGQTNDAMGGNSSGTNGQTNTSGIAVFGDGSGVGLSNTATPGLAASFTLYDPLSSTNVKFVSGRGVAVYSGTGSRYMFLFGGVYKITTAANAFRIIMSSGNITSGTVRLYGVAH